MRKISNCPHIDSFTVDTIKDFILGENLYYFLQDRNEVLKVELNRALNHETHIPKEVINDMKLFSIIALLTNNYEENRI